MVAYIFVCFVVLALMTLAGGAGGFISGLAINCVIGVIWLTFWAIGTADSDSSFDSAPALSHHVIT